MLALYNNGGRETGFGKGPEVVSPEKVLNVELAVDARYTDAVEWIGRTRLRLPDVNGRRTLSVTLVPGDVKVVEIQPNPIPPPTKTEAVNLAEGKAATASSSRDAAHGPTAAVNGITDITDGWQSQDGFPQELTIDLGAIELVTSVNLKLAWPEQDIVDARAAWRQPKVYQYHVEWSPNGRNWSLLFDARSNQSPEHPKGYHRFFEQPVPVRCLKVVIDGSSTEKNAHVVELEVFGRRAARRRMPGRMPSEPTPEPPGLVAVSPPAWSKEERDSRAARLCLCTTFRLQMRLGCDHCRVCLITMP